MKKFLTLFFVFAFLSPVLVFAHQPRFVSENPVIITDPEISKAYYGQLMGDPQIFTISTTSSFNLYVNVLTPDKVGQKTDLSVAIIKNGELEKPIVILDGPSFQWKKFHEPFGYDNYLTGPEYRSVVDAGEYEIMVWSSNNDSKYSLAIGEKENFDFKETVNAIKLIPTIKKTIFDKSPIDFVMSPFGAGYIIIIYILVAILWYVLRFVFKIKGKEVKNITRNDRIIRAILGTIILLWTISTNWNILLIILSALLLFQAISGWCILYSIIKK